MSSRWHALRDTYRLLLGGTRGYILTFALVDASFLLTDRRWVGERAWTLALTRRKVRAFRRRQNVPECIRRKRPCAMFASLPQPLRYL